MASTLLLRSRTLPRSLLPAVFLVASSLRAAPGLRSAGSHTRAAARGGWGEGWEELAAVAIDGALGGGDFGDDYRRPAEALQREAVLRGVGQCIDPEDPYRLYNDDDEWDKLVWSKTDREGALGVDGWSNYAFGNRRLPLHMMIGLLRNDSKYPAHPPEDFDENHNLHLDAECFAFDYGQAGGADPAGCRVFERTFRPLQELRGCIVEQLDKDPIWTGRESTVITEGEFTGIYNDWCQQSVWKYVKVGIWPLQVGLPARLCSRFDSKRRAQEIIKMALFQELPDDAREAGRQIERKLCKTVTWPQGRPDLPCLEKATATAIRTQCFKVEEGKSLEQAHFLGRISPCLPLMFDKVEIQGFGLNDGVAKFQTEDFYGSEEQNFQQAYTPQAPAVCGRLALAAIPAFQGARYMATSARSMISDSLSWDTEPSWDECLHVKTTNCRKMYFCWEKSLRRMCGLSPQCCPPGHGHSRLRVHRACQDRPDEGDCPAALSTHSGQ